MSTALETAAALVGAALPNGDGVAVAMGDDDALLALLQARAVAAVDVATDSVGTASAVVLGTALAHPDHARVLHGLRESVGDETRVIAVVANAAHVDRRLAGLRADAPAELALPLGAARDRLEAAGFLVERVERVRRAGASPAQLLGSGSESLARYLAGDPEATVDLYVLHATSSSAAGQIAAARERERTLERERDDALLRATALRDAAAEAEIAALRRRVEEQEQALTTGDRLLAQARGEAEGLRVRVEDAEAERARVIAELASLADQTARERFENAARIRDLEQHVAELEAAGPAAQDSAAVQRAAAVEAQLHTITNAHAYRAVEGYWRLKRRMIGR